MGPRRPGTSTAWPAAARSRSAGLRAMATQGEAVASATVSMAVTSPPAPLRIVPLGPGSKGARLLATMGDQGPRTRPVYSRIDVLFAIDNGEPVNLQSHYHLLQLGGWIYTGAWESC